MRNKENTKEAEGILIRISKEMERQGKKQAELVKYLDLPLGTYTNWKLGKSRNFCEHLGEIARFLNVSTEYLVTGSVAEKMIENSREKELLACYRKLNEEKQDAVLQNVKWLAE